MMRLHCAAIVCIVRNQDYVCPCRVELTLRTLKNFFARTAVERASRLVGENKIAAVHQSARNTHALLLTTRQLRPDDGRAIG